jgi:hypothetical protein
MLLSSCVSDHIKPQPQGILDNNPKELKRGTIRSHGKNKLIERRSDSISSEIAQVAKTAPVAQP